MPETFAFNGVGAAPVRSGVSGQSQGAQVVGGESRGGAVTPRDQTDAGPVAAGLGQFVEQFMAPHIQARQQEQFFKGFTAAESGEATAEIAKSRGGFSKIFGPTSYEQGAAFFTAKSKVEQWQQARLNEVGTLKQMAPDEAFKVLAKTSRDMMTGNPYADQLVQQSLIEASGPLMNTVAKARYKWQQDNALKAWSGSVDSGATALQSLAGQQAALSAPDDDGAKAYTQQRGLFLSGLAKPAGMDDETYRTGLFNSARNMLASGNLFAFHALEAAGLTAPGGPLADDKIAALEEAEHKANTRALADASMAPDVVAAMAGIQADIESGRITAPMEAARRIAAVNATLMRRTGSTEPMYDTGAVVNVANAVTDAAVAAARRQQERTWQLQDRQATWAHEDAVREREQAQNVAQVSAAMATGNAATFLAKGVGHKEDYDSLAFSLWSKGDTDTLAKNFNGGGYVADPVSKMIKSQIGAFEGKYTPAFANAYQRWKASDAKSPGAAAAYYGEYNVRLKAYDGLIGEGVPAVVAYERTLSNPSAFDTATMEPDKRKGLKAAVDSAADSMTRHTFNPFSWNRYDLSQSAVDTIKGVVGNEAVQYLAHTNLSPSAVFGQVARTALAAGHYEVVGRFAWKNDGNTPPLAQVLRAQQPDLDRAFMAVADRRLKAEGFTEGAYNAQDYSLHRFGNAAVYVSAFSADGSEHRGALIRTPELKAELERIARGEVEAANPSPAQFAAQQAARQGLDPNRKIKGEGQWDRLVRINRENADRGALERRWSVDDLPDGGTLKSALNVVGKVGEVAAPMRGSNVVVDAMLRAPGPAKAVVDGVSAVVRHARNRGKDIKNRGKK